jgi:hypothetical protein
VNQEIGIVFGVKGDDVVDRTFIRIGESITRLYSQIDTLTTKFTGLMSSADASIGAFRGIAENLNSVGAAARTANSQLSNLNRELAVAQKVSNKISPVGAGGVAPVGAGTTKPSKTGSPRTESQMGFGPAGFMARWWLYSSMFQGTGGMLKDVGLGAAREPLVNPLRDMAMIGFDKKQRLQTEIKGQDFLRKVWVAGGIEDYLKAVAEVGSALDVNDPQFKGQGVEALNRMAQNVMRLAASSQMTPQAASKSLMAATHSQLFQMPEKEQKAYAAGDKSIADLSETTAAKMAKIIKVSSIWGPDLSRFLDYSMPSALSKGWSLDMMLGYAGTMRTAGYPGQKVGRGLRSLLEAETGKMGLLAAAGSENEDTFNLFKGLKGTEKKKLQEKLVPLINKQLKDDPIGLFEKMGKWIERAEQRGVDLQQSLGFSKEWVGHVRMASKPGTIARWRKSTEESSKATSMGEVQGQIDDAQDEVGTLTTRLDNSWKAFKQATARTGAAKNMVSSWTSAMDLMTNAFNSDEKIGYLDVLKEGGNFLLHGVLGGINDELGKLGVEIGKSLKLLPEDFKPPSFEEGLEQLKGIPEKLKSIVDSITEFSSKLGQGIDDVWNRIKSLSPFAPGQDPTEKTIRQERELDKMRDTPVPKIEPKDMYQGDNPILQKILPGQQSSLDDGGGSLQGAMVQLASAITGVGGGQGGSALQGAGAEGGGGTQVRVFIGERELRDIVIEAIRDHNMLNRNQWGNSSI